MRRDGGIRRGRGSYNKLQQASNRREADEVEALIALVFYLYAEVVDGFPTLHRFLSEEDALYPLSKSYKGWVNKEVYRTFKIAFLRANPERRWSEFPDPEF